MKSLYISGNRLQRKLIEGNKLPSQLAFLSVSSNFLEARIPKSFSNSCALPSLELIDNRLSEEFSMVMYHLSRCARYSLQKLYLGMNEINVTLPNLSIFPCLKVLNVGSNRLNGEITKIFNVHLN